MERKAIEMKIMIHSIFMIQNTLLYGMTSENIEFLCVREQVQKWRQQDIQKLYCLRCTWENSQAKTNTSIFYLCLLSMSHFP